jgi:hypothetical protein
LTGNSVPWWRGHFPAWRFGEIQIYCPVNVGNGDLTGWRHRTGNGAALLDLIANSSPVAFGALGNPVRTLVAVTGLPEADFSAMLGRILPLTTLVLPFWSSSARRARPSPSGPDSLPAG